MSWHGTAGGYRNHYCRCDDCRAAWAESQMVMKLKRRMRMAGGVVAGRPDALSVPRSHGTSTYFNWKCRCETCRTAFSTYQAARYRARKAKTVN